MLEVIEKGGVSSAHPAPLLFVHGAWHAAWCWEVNFLDYFAGNGYLAAAVSLRGHGGSAALRPRWCSVADYVADVSAAAETLPTTPVVIGHSMGGLVVQKYLERYHAPAAVLMAAMPPRGSFASGLRWIRRHPVHFTRLAVTGQSLKYVNTPRLARERFFSAQTADSEVLRYTPLLEEERARRAYLDCLLLNLPRPRRVTTAVLVMGAGEDGAITRNEVLATAAAYRTPAEFFAGMGHDMMLEPGWQCAAQRIHTWLGERGL
jgi:pimeloyl-ACP methyl ester carboxylesterase